VLFSVKGSALGRTAPPAIDNDLLPEEKLEKDGPAKDLVAIETIS
jgi:hypothetical protein